MILLAGRGLCSRRHDSEGVNGRIERGDHLGMGAYLIVVPVNYRPHGLPFEYPADVVDRQRKFAASTDDGAERTKSPCISRPNRHRNVQPGKSEGSLTPAPLVRDEFASSGKYRDSGIDAFCLPVHIPGRDRSGPDGSSRPCDDANPENVDASVGYLLRWIDDRGAVEGHSFLPA